MLRKQVTISYCLDNATTLWAVKAMYVRDDFYERSLYKLNRKMPIGMRSFSKYNIAWRTPIYIYEVTYL